MNVAIRITIFRLILVPVFLALLLVYRGTEPGSAEWLRYTALVVFIVASVSDVIDGYVARSRGITTRLGGLLDPLADKLLFGLGIIVLSLPPVKEGFPFEPPALWYPIAVVATNLALGIGTLSSYILHKKVVIKAVPLGKAAAVLQTATMCWIMLRIPGVEFFYYPAGVLTVASGIVYVSGAIQQAGSAEAPEG
ncbi:CDP-alcohol phosphatidyltransferase family protein [bacterium]|nr:CDP-alcohol phosphatidyltransferase family protein [bacterium]